MNGVLQITALAVAETWVTSWLTPVWLLGVGVLGGLLLLLVVWGLAALASRIPGVNECAAAVDRGDASWGEWAVGALATLVSRRTVAEVPLAIREGVLWPVMIIAGVLAAFAIVGTPLVHEPLRIIRSMARLPYVGTEKYVFEVPVSDPEDPNDRLSDRVAHVLEDLHLNAEEVRELFFHSDQNLTVASKPFVEVKPGAALEVLANEKTAWVRIPDNPSPFFDQDATALYVRNLGSAPAQLQLTIVTAPPVPEVASIPVTALSVAGLFLFYILLRAVAPKLSAIALATYKNESSQPLFGILVIVGVVAIAAFVWTPFFTLGEDIKMLKDGMVFIMLLGIFEAVWAASTSVSEEIEGRTALTVLSKPIGRRSFIIGKFLGIAWTVLLIFVILGLLLMVATSYKPIYDARESVTKDMTWQSCHMEMISIVPGLVLGFMETTMLAAISVAISTRLPMMANFVICLAIYVLGHLTPLIVQSSIGQFPVVRFFGELIAVIFPNLDHFNILPAIAGGQAVPALYLGIVFLYWLVYCLIALLLALFLFEDRDLA